MPELDARPLGNTEIAKLERWTAPAMVCLSLLTLAAVATLLHALPEADEVWERLGIAGLVLTYPLVWAEVAFYGLYGGRLGPLDVWACLLPPLRLASRDRATGQRVYLPGVGWLAATDESRRSCAAALNVPMVVISVVALPLLAVEIYLHDWLETHLGLKYALAVAQGAIWWAFAAEFMVMLSLQRQRLRYCREHWIDLVIVVLPLLASLRLLQVGRVLRVQQVVRASRALRLKRVGLRLFQVLVVVNLARRLRRTNPVAYLARLREREAEQLQALDELQGEIREIELELAERALVVRRAA